MSENNHRLIIANIWNVGALLSNEMGITLICIFFSLLWFILYLIGERLERKYRRESDGK